MDDKQYKFWLRLYAAITLVWLVLMTLGCIAVFQVIVAHAEEPSVIMNGEYIICEINTQDDAMEIQEGSPINDVSIALDEVDANGHQLSYLGEFRISFYCSCSRCNGRWGAIDGFGKPLKWGCVAVDPAVIPMHTKLVIDGYDMVFEARDTGSGVDGRHIDMYVPVSHAEALAMPNGTKVKVWRYE